MGAIEDGAELPNSADAYAAGEIRIASSLRRTAHTDIAIATKVGFIGDPGSRVACANPVHIRRSCEDLLRRLGIDVIDTLFLHRVDPSVPLEASIGAMKRTVDAGNVRHLGLCADCIDYIRRAHAEHPLAYVQTEFSPFFRSPA